MVAAQIDKVKESYHSIVSLSYVHAAAVHATAMLCCAAVVCSTIAQQQCFYQTRPGLPGIVGVIIWHYYYCMI